MENGIITYICGEKDEGVRLSDILKSRMNIFSSTLKRLKAHGGIFLNGENAHVNVTVKNGDTVRADLSAAEIPTLIPPEEPEPEIAYESESLLAVRKNAMSVVHPTCFHRTGTVAANVALYYRNRGIKAGIHLVNRLDLGTSGLLLFAKSGWAQEIMRREAEEGSYRKTYIGICDVTDYDGPCEEGFTETVDLPVARDLSSIIKRKVDPEGSRAVTVFRIIAADRSRKRILAAFSLLTGRTHQIRVHMSHIGLPLTGDTLYSPLYMTGREEGPTERARSETQDGHQPHQLLHHYQCGFDDPLSGVRTVVSCPAPEEFTELFPGCFSGGLLLPPYARYLFPL